MREPSLTRRVCLAGLALGIALVSAGCLQMTVRKQVVGGTWEFPFTVDLACVPLTLAGGAAERIEQRFTFDAGNVGLPQHFGEIFPFGAYCALAESQEGGATSVTIACDNPPAGVDCSEPARYLLIAVSPAGSRSVSIIVTNTFTPPPAVEEE